MLDSEDGAQGFVLAHEAESNETVPLREIDWGRRVFGLDSHHAGLDLRRRLEAVFRDFDEMVNSCK